MDLCRIRPQGLTDFWTLNWILISIWVRLKNVNDHLTKAMVRTYTVSEPTELGGILELCLQLFHI